MSKLSVFNPVRWVQAYNMARAIMKAHPLGSLAFYRGFGQRQPKPDQMRSDLEAVILDPFVWGAVGGICRSVSEAPLVAQEYKRQDGKDVWVLDESSPLAQLISYPNPVEGTMELVWKAMLNQLQSGNAYWLFSDDFKEIWHCRSDWVSANVNDDGIPESYEIRNYRGEEKTLPAAQVVHFRLPAVTNPTYGDSPVKPIRGAILTNYFFAKFVEEFFEEGAVPGGLITSEQVINEKRRDEARTEWNKIHKGPGKGRGHEVAFLGSGYSYQTISPPLKDLVVEAVQTLSKDRINAVYGTPPIINGDWDRATLNNADKMIRLWWQSGLLPQMRLFAQAFNRALRATPLIESPTRNVPRRRVKFWTEEVWALQEDKNAAAERSVKIYGGGVATLNEAREMIGLPRVEIGDEFKPMPMAIQFDTGQSSLAYHPGRRPAFGGPAQLGAPALRLASDAGDYQIWSNMVSRSVRFEAQLKPEVQGFFDAELELVIDRLYRLTGNGTSLAALYAMIRTKEDDFLPPDISKLFDIDEENRRLVQTFGPLFVQLAEEAGTESLAEFGLGFSFDVRTPRATAFIDGMANKMKDVNQTTWAALKNILATAEEEGWNLQTTVNQLKQWPQLFDDQRATTVVRTEGTTIANGSSLEAWYQAGVGFKRWIASMDEATRLSHVQANGQIVGITEKFQLAGGVADYPGDYRLPANERINCRCTHAPSETGPQQEEE